MKGETVCVTIVGKVAKKQNDDRNDEHKRHREVQVSGQMGIKRLQRADGRRGAVKSGGNCEI